MYVCVYICFYLFIFFWSIMNLLKASIIEYWHYDILENNVGKHDKEITFQLHLEEVLQNACCCNIYCKKGHIVATELLSSFHYFCLSFYFAWSKQVFSIYPEWQWWFILAGTYLQRNTFVLASCLGACYKYLYVHKIRLSIMITLLKP